MDAKKALYYAAIIVGLLIAVSVVGTLISIAVGITLWAVSWAINLAIVAAVIYGGYKLASWVLSSGSSTSVPGRSGSEPSSSSTASGGSGSPQDRQDRLRQQYVEGQISEAEFERRIANELETEGLDEIDQELERER